MNYVVNDISYKYTPDGKEVLKKVNFSIEKGKVTAIVGPSGCGKSTLVQIFSQVIPKLIGNGELQGSFDVPEGTFVSVVSQSPENQLFGYGVEDAIAFGMENLGLPQEEIMERMEYVLDLLNLQYLRNRSVANLSGGQRQALTLLMATLVTPKLLLLDEHTAALDPSTAEKVLELTRSIVAENNITCMMITHNIRSALELGNRTIMMDAGRIVLDLAGEERAGMTVDALLEKFRTSAGKELDNDRILLSDRE